MVRPRKYDWEDKRDICHKLYVDQGKTSGDIVRYFAQHFAIPESDLPSRNQFHAKFKEWGFPGRVPKFSPEEEDAVVQRIREMFQQNLSALEQTRILKAEGWDIDDYHIRKFRRKHGMLLRVNTGGYQKGQTEPADGSTPGPTPGPTPGQDAAEPVDATEGAATEGPATEAMTLAPLPPEEVARREQRLRDMEVDSANKLSARKRRRRIRGYGHLPADGADVPPRYGSETSLDECKAFLMLSNESYVLMRAQYEAICRDMGIIKMTLCADGQWQESKDRLVRESPHLSAILHPLQPDLDKRYLALNCICSDVTKRMRNASKFMSMADANNVLGIDPVQSKQLRRLLYDILEADHFTTTVACGKDRFEEIRQLWYSRSPILQAAVATGDREKLRAVELLNKDARKRYGDDLIKKDPSKKTWTKNAHAGPGPGPAQGLPHAANAKPIAPSPGPGPARKKRRTTAPASSAPTCVVPAPAPAAPVPAPEAAMPFNLDPLLSAPPGPTTWPEPMPMPPPTSAPVPAYFRLAPASLAVGPHPRLWIDKLPARTLAGLAQAATSRAPGALELVKAHGVVARLPGGEAGEAAEDAWLIESDDELQVYLEAAGEKPTFVVLLQGGYA